MTAPGAPGVAPPTPAQRIVWAIGALGLGVVASLFVGAIVIGAGGWDLDVSAADGADWGRVVGQYGVAAPLDHNRMPLVVQVLLNLPLWGAFVGVPWVLARRGRLDWRRDLAWGMRPLDAPVGFAVGVATQLVLVPLLYVPILELIDDADLDGPARDLVAAATGPVDIVALVALTVVGAPIAEEILYRGMLFTGIADLEADRGRLGLLLAVVTSAALFAASHLQALQFPGLFLIGVVLAMAVRRTGRLGAAIWVHAGFNATTVAILLPELF